MAHAKIDDLKDIALLLEQLRGIETLKEKSLGCFYRKGKGVLHFHVQNGRRFAHIFDGTKWIEHDISAAPSKAKQKLHFKELHEALNR